MKHVFRRDYYPEDEDLPEGAVCCIRDVLVNSESLFDQVPNGDEVILLAYMIGSTLYIHERGMVILEGCSRCSDALLDSARYLMRTNHTFRYRLIEEEPMKVEYLSAVKGITRE